MSQSSSRALSKLALAFAVSVAACSERSPVAPSSASGFGPEVTPLSAPTDLRAEFLANGGGVVISWTYGSSSSGASGVAGFLVERALGPAGPWSIHGFTQATNIGDALSADQRCYRVTALSSSSSTLDSPPSPALCIVGSAQGV